MKAVISINRFEIVELLLKAGANTNVKNMVRFIVVLVHQLSSRLVVSNGVFIFFLLKFSSQSQVSSVQFLLLQCAFGCIWLVLFFCLLLSVQNGDTALMKAVRNNHVEIVELLLKAGADINAKNNVCAHSVAAFTFVMVLVCCQSGGTSLLFAASRENIEVVQLLLNNGANVNDTNNVLMI